MGLINRNQLSGIISSGIPEVRHEVAGLTTNRAYCRRISDRRQLFVCSLPEWKDFTVLPEEQILPSSVPGNLPAAPIRQTHSLLVIAS